MGWRGIVGEGWKGNHGERVLGSIPEGDRHSAAKHLSSPPRDALKLTGGAETHPSSHEYEDFLLLVADGELPGKCEPTPTPTLIRGGEILAGSQSRIYS